MNLLLESPYATVHEPRESRQANVVCVRCKPCGGAISSSVLRSTRAVSSIIAAAEITRIVFRLPVGELLLIIPSINAAPDLFWNLNDEARNRKNKSKGHVLSRITH